MFNICLLHRTMESDHFPCSFLGSMVHLVSEAVWQMRLRILWKRAPPSLCFRRAPGAATASCCISAQSSMSWNHQSVIRDVFLWHKLKMLGFALHRSPCASVLCTPFFHSRDQHSQFTMLVEPRYKPADLYSLLPFCYTVFWFALRCNKMT